MENHKACVCRWVSDNHSSGKEKLDPNHMDNNSSDFHVDQKRSVIYGFTGALLSAVTRQPAGHQHIYYSPAVICTLQLSRRNLEAPNTTEAFD